MWLKNKCATLITRIARGAIARLGARLERARLQRLEKDRFASEQHAVEVAMDVARKEIVLYLAAGKVRALLPCTLVPHLNNNAGVRY
jgi:hypothetical protein